MEDNTPLFGTKFSGRGAASDSSRVFSELEEGEGVKEGRYHR